MNGTSDKKLIENAMIPFDTRDLHMIDIDNFYLRFHKLSNKDKEDNIKINLQNIRTSFNNLNMENLSENYLSNIEKLNLYIKHFKYETDGRLAVGLGSESVYETSMCLHYIYGFPYIPGQTIKGILRNYIISEIFYGEEETALDNTTFCRLFGCDENGVIGLSKGIVYFFDAYPTSSPTLKLDVMNPHYGSYYKDETNKVFPVDYDDTIPINFVTVEHTEFGFILGFKKNINDRIEEYINEPVNNLWSETQKEFLNKSLSQIVCDYLKEALEEHGIGAKTSVGYGYFNIIKKQQDERLEVEINKEKSIQDEINRISKISDRNKKLQIINEIYNNIDNLNEKQKKQLADFMKECF